ncbi:hypothetical protein PULV_a1887 [Pseudoalteromonas ulvae UL12]|uniref:Type 4 fimbrial biogenesis protein PilX N-terminal domain-containing protein n=1 Tax=Pseudoalteromonas ulvae TaxID=107327 RepID=A0A244CPZ1_PSEDV|nr:pilus assembly PilX N-terminal domain-containing protein [Pseudoalteromonas ulvae]MBE0365141.1 hypothetical protein [Pseudoalteromonas ulvae UL12]OUL57690.1 hypothetical protein B1199_11565 [Pseudoalteromonas ulvae]
MKQMKKQQGFTIVVVLLLSMMASVVVISSLKDTTMQERLSGNFEKQTNARLAAESGLFSTHTYLQGQLAELPTSTLEDLINNIGEGGLKTYVANNSLEGMLANIELSKTSDGLLSVASGGKRHEGEKKVRALYELVPGTGQSLKSPYHDGLIGCEGVTLTGSGKADSYDSSLGEYGASYIQNGQTLINKGDVVTVRTLTGGSKVIVRGSAQIEGDLITPGQIEFNGGASVSGTVHTNGYFYNSSDIKIGGDLIAYEYIYKKNNQIGGSIKSNGYIKLLNMSVGGDILTRDTISLTGVSPVGGNVLAGSDLYIQASNVTGTVSTHGNLTFLAGNLGATKVKGNVDMSSWHGDKTFANDSLRYMGAFHSNSNTARFNTAPFKVNFVSIPEAEIIEKLPEDDGLLDPSNPQDRTCDPLNIKTEIETVDIKAIDVKDLFVHSNSTYSFGETTSLFTNSNGSDSSPVKTLVATKSSFLGNSADILMFDNLEIKGTLKIAENSDVVMYVKGNFKMSGSSSLTIPDTSSLTLIMKGALDIGAGAQIYTPAKGLTDEGVPIFSIYSSYSGTGIKITGGTEEIYAVVYAPLTDVEIASSSDFKGALVGKKVAITGAGAFHYDSALKNAKVGNDNSKATTPQLVFKGWRYHAESEAQEEPLSK